MVFVHLNSKKIIEFATSNPEEILGFLEKQTGCSSKEVYLEQNGKNLRAGDLHIDDAIPVYCRLRVLGGKGGFGSMLRAIGAQIEKTTNREACRDLSGRRLRDINEEKRLKSWMENQSEREREAEERKKRKIAKLLHVSKHEFKDEEYEEARSKLVETVNTAVEEGFKKTLDADNNLKRKNIEMPTTSANALKNKKRKLGLWLDDDILNDSSDDTSSIDDVDTDNEPNSSSKMDLQKDPKPLENLTSKSEDDKETEKTELEKEVETVENLTSKCSDDEEVEKTVLQKEVETVENLIRKSEDNEETVAAGLQKETEAVKNLTGKSEDGEEVEKTVLQKEAETVENLTSKSEDGEEVEKTVLQKDAETVENLTSKSEDDEEGEKTELQNEAETVENLIRKSEDDKEVEIIIN